MPVFVDLSLFWRWTSTYQNLKGWLSHNCELQSFVFQKVPIWQRLLANQLGEFEYNFRCLKRFFRKVPRKLRSAFFLKLRFLKIRLLITWLKCRDPDSPNLSWTCYPCIYTYIFQGSNFPIHYYALKTLFKLFRYKKKFKKILENQL